MHFGFVRDTKILAMVGVAVLIASCAQQATKSVPTTSPSPAETKSPPTQTPTATPKPKSKPKPAPKPETVETETTPPAPIEGIEQSKVGYYFDTLQGRLRQLSDPNLVVNRLGDQITIDLTHSVHLDSDIASCDAVHDARADRQSAGRISHDAGTRRRCCGVE